MNIQRLLQKLDDLDDELISISVYLRKVADKRRLKDSLEVIYSFEESVNTANDLIDDINKMLFDCTANAKELKENDIINLNNKIKNLYDDISIVMASYNMTRKHTKTEKALYKSLCNNLYILEKSKNALSKKTAYHVVRLKKPSKQQGNKLMYENLQSFLNDLFSKMNESVEA